MTAKEFYNWAVENNAENLEIGVQYQDDGGSYIGNTFEDRWSNYYGVSVTLEKKTGIHSLEVVDGKYHRNPLPDIPYVLIE